MVCFSNRSLKINDVLEFDVAGDISRSDHVFVSFGLVFDYSHIGLYVQVVNLLMYQNINSKNKTSSLCEIFTKNILWEKQFESRRLDKSSMLLHLEVSIIKLKICFLIKKLLKKEVTSIKKKSTKWDSS